MSSDFQKVLVEDDRLVCTDQIKYAVNKGGQNMTSSQYAAISQSTSSHTYNIQCPSEMTIIDRRVLWKSTVVLQITGTATVGQFLVNYGISDALAPFPLHQLCTNMTATVNNNSVSINTKDVLASILRFNDSRVLQRYNGYTPTMPDTYKSYSDAVGSINNPLGSWVNTSDNDLSPRGSWQLVPFDAAGLIFVSTDPVTPAQVAVSTGVAQTVYVKFTVTEPLLLSPFIFADPKSNNQGFYGIQNLNFVMNIGNGNRCWRSANNYGQSVVPYQFSNSQLIFNFLTCHPSTLLPSRNVVPFYELPRYLTSSLPSFDAYGGTAARQLVRTSTLQLNQIPDKLIIFVRKSMSSQTCSDTDSFMVINSLSINFNNQSGILASATQQDIYRYSVENGSNQSWYEFSGFANKPNPMTGGCSLVPTAGSMVVLEFGKDIQLVEDFYSSGSLGNFALQVNLDVTNQASSAVSDAEIVLITMNSGCFVCEKGTSSTYTGLLTKQDVLDASSQEPYSRSDVARLVGGGFLDTLKSVAGKILPKLPSLAKEGLKLIDNKYANAGANLLGNLGYGRSGGAAHRLESKLM
jgi:hypothetical protein